MKRRDVGRGGRNKTEKDEELDKRIIKRTKKNEKDKTSIEGKDKTKVGQRTPNE